MKAKKKKILERAKMIINTYRDDPNAYYDELLKTYNEYKALNNIDNVTDNLYLTHIEQLCHLIVEKRHIHYAIALVTLLFIGMLSFTIYSGYRYYALAKNIKNNIINRTMDNSLIVEYYNVSNFVATPIEEGEDYKYIEPMTFRISAVNKTDTLKKIKYDVYLIEENKDINVNRLIPRNAFLYNIEIDNMYSNVFNLNTRAINNGKIHLYSGEFLNNQTEEVNLRMWLDNNLNIDYLNKYYRFKLYVEGYAEK